MSKFEDEVRGTLKDISIDITAIKITLAKNTVHLKEHMKRSDEIERNNDLKAAELKLDIDKIADVQKNVTVKHVTLVNGGIKLMGILATLLVVVAGIVKLVGSIQDLY